MSDEELLEVLICIVDAQLFKTANIIIEKLTFQLYYDWYVVSILNQ